MMGLLLMVAARKPESTPHGGGWRGASGYAPRWLVALHNGDKGSAVRPLLSGEIFIMRGRDGG
jgi:hypothetical protein